MIDIKRYNGTEEFDKLLKTFSIIPTNTEIVEKTKVSKGSVSEIMAGKRKPSKKFIEKFKKGFNIDIDNSQKAIPESGTELLKDKLIENLERYVRRLEDDLDRMRDERIQPQK